MKIGIIVGSTRQNRAGKQIGEWVAARAEVRTDATFELVDLADFNLPFMTSPLPPAALGKQYPEPEIQAWSKKIDEFDGFILVTPEYNHGVPAAFKNAVDVLGSEWMKKAVGFVSYGADGGVRAVENWRVILANFNIYDIRNAVSINIFTEMSDGAFSPNERRAAEVKDLLDTLVPAAQAMATLR
ncbi:MAG: NAD(P)H-dependent oxidoreductase [Luteococcus sp.]|uniref:NADPH-dependent FMN reductase n=1 Tax=Luteococcus sp. TaxID=1969402 RepID=UPI002648CCC4|nr:NAD(P)H-dependent oxidoreductase [Luteococcus sp.]MDN5562217.1 NAD(P)H-dependent oxidoreductase [Luteococcus sp.]